MSGLKVLEHCNSAATCVLVTRVVRNIGDGRVKIAGFLSPKHLLPSLYPEDSKVTLKISYEQFREEWRFLSPPMYELRWIYPEDKPELLALDDEKENYVYLCS